MKKLVIFLVVVFLMFCMRGAALMAQDKEPIQQSDGDDGMVVFEAEDYDVMVPSDPIGDEMTVYEWVERDDIGILASDWDPDSGLDSLYRSGGKCMRAEPVEPRAKVSQGEIMMNPYNSTYMEYNVNFVKSDTHYVWVRGMCDTMDINDSDAIGGHDSGSIGIDDFLSTSGVKVQWYSTYDYFWWTGGWPEHDIKYIMVDSPGVHRVQFWMRESGTNIDKIVLTTNKQWRPENPVGLGPANSPRGTSSVKDNNNNKPNSFKLDPNFPNPFNPTTTISYAVPRQEHVTIKVYDLLGNEMNTLVNSLHASGEYQTSWNGHTQAGTPVPSGIYFYEMKAGHFSSLKKMMFVK